jgi:hypothetical protein
VVVWASALRLEQSMDLTDEQREASEALICEPPHRVVVKKGLDGIWGMH